MSESEGSSDSEGSDLMTDSEICVEVNEEDEEMIAGISTSVPTATNSPQRGRSSSKNKEKSDKLKKPLFTCRSCPRQNSYYTIEGVKKHMTQHRVQELMRSGPGFSAAIEEFRKISKDVLNELCNMKVKGGYTPAIEEFAQCLLNLSEYEIRSFIDDVAAILWDCLPLPTQLVTPDTLHSDYRKAVHSALGKVCAEQCLKQQLKEIVVPVLKKEPEDCALTWFISEMLNRSSFKLEAFYLRSLREPFMVLADLHASLNTEEEKEWDTLNFKQSVHYVGGSAMRGIVRAAYAHQKSRVWCEVANCVKTQLCAGPLISGPDEEISSWTEARDRGGLMHMSEAAWTFFMGLSGVLHDMEKSGCPIKVEDVLVNVLKDDVVSALWSDAVGNSLSAPDKEFLLKELCSRFINTYGEGMSLKAKNTVVNNLRDKAPLRATLLFRKETVNTAM